MKKFLVLYTSSVSAKDQMAKATPEQAKAGMEQWIAWQKKAGSAVVDLGAPVDSAASSPKIGGYSILQAESARALEALLAEHPHRQAPGATILVHEFLQLPGM